MRRRPVTVRALDRQEEVAEKVSKYNLLAVPVLEEDGRVVGFVTVDDVIDVLVEDETDRALRIGAVEPGALDQPYMKTSFLLQVRKRATWLVILFVGEMLTATAMGYFEAEYLQGRRVGAIRCRRLSRAGVIPDLRPVPWSSGRWL